MSDLDVIEIPGYPGMHARRVLVEAWQAAGSPAITKPKGAGRLYADQKELWDGWREGLAGYYPADNPDDETQALGHVRFAALDIDPTPERVERLERAGLVRPFSYEPWHWALPNVRKYPVVRSIPITAGGSSSAAILEELIVMDKCTIIHITKGKVTTYALIGASVPGGVRTTTLTETANAWALLYGPSTLAKSQAVWDTALREARQLNASWLAQQKLINGKQETQ